MKQNLKFKECFIVDPIGLSGGLYVFWRANLNIQILHSHVNFIHISISECQMGTQWLMTFIYANLDFTTRRDL